MTDFALLVAMLEGGPPKCDIGHAIAAARGAKSVPKNKAGRRKWLI
jgi:hypothetical protein